MLATPVYATEWSGGSVIDLGGLPGTTGSFALGINDAGQVVGYSFVGGVASTPPSGAAAASSTSAACRAARSYASGINDAGQVVGYSVVGDLPTPPSGAAAASSTSARAVAQSVSTMPDRSVGVSLGYPRTLDLGDDAARLRGPRLCGVSQGQNRGRVASRSAHRAPHNVLPTGTRLSSQSGALAPHAPV